MIDIKLAILIFLALFGVVVWAAIFMKAFKSNGGFKLVFGILGTLAIAYALVGMGAQFEWYTLPTSAAQFFLAASVPSGYTPSYPTYVPSGGSGGQNYQPTATYATQQHQFQELLIINQEVHQQLQQL